jgi:hypothetical protein
VPLDGPPEQVDIIIRSTIESAERAPRIMNDTEVWVGEIVFEDVDVEYLEAAETPYRTIETDEALREFIESMDLRAIEFRQAGDTLSIYSRGGFTFVPYNYAYRCTLRLGERELGGSASAIRAGEVRELYFGDRKIDEFPPDLQSIDVVFSPDIGWGARTFTEEDLVFNRGFVIEDVPVMWIRE